MNAPVSPISLHRMSGTLQTLAAVLAGAALLSACSVDDAVPTALQPPEARLAKGGQVDTRSRANFSWANSVNVGTAAEPTWVPAGIRGDGRLKDGSMAPVGAAPSNEYQGAYCGVAAWFDDGSTGTGHLNITPGANWTSTMQAKCGAMRMYNFYLNGPGAAPYTVSSKTLARGLYKLAVGQVSLQYEGFGVSLPNSCDIVMFDDASPPSNSPVQTRLADSTRADGVQVRRWTVSSRGSHLAVCGYTNNRGVFVTTGPQYYLPFALTITEVPYPFPTYP